MAGRLLLDPAELVEHALPVRALLLELMLRLFWSEQPEEERPQRCIAADSALRRRLEQPTPQVREPCVGDGVVFELRAPESICSMRPLSDHRPTVAPDVRVELTSAQYFAGRDPVLERALKVL